jgi:hypothetical protein
VKLAKVVVGVVMITAAYVVIARLALLITLRH